MSVRASAGAMTAMTGRRPEERMRFALLAGSVHVDVVIGFTLKVEYICSICGVKGNISRP
jgi:hypothetical protein